MELTIGAPVFERAWILGKWFRHLSEQEMPEGLGLQDVTIILNDGGSGDGTLDIIDAWRDRVPWKVEVIDSSHIDDHDARRAWSAARYETMATLRNMILERVREIDPDYHWSHDTDILAPSETLQTLLQGQERFDGTAPTVYMTKRSKMHPNSMRWIHGDRARRMIPEEGGDDFWRVGVAFASILMNRDLYAVDYAAHDQGEDIGWGLKVREAGLTIGVHPDCKCKHVMTLEQLTTVDSRVGF